VCKGGGRSTAFSSKFKKYLLIFGRFVENGVGKEKDFSENFRRTHPMKVEKNSGSLPLQVRRVEFS